MLHDNTPDLDPKPGRPAEIEPVSPRDAALILGQALEPYLADGWRVLDRDAYAARLTRGDRNLEVRVDLLGQVEAQETGLSALQDSGRLVAWVLLITALLLALAVTSALGLW
ncbi:MAG: hypothetical protein AAGU78_07095 [Chloroflexota bacterium]|jgi:hypothetical protein|nr:hypothetical protein [Anaerolineae bacterium]